MWRKINREALQLNFVHSDLFKLYSLLIKLSISAYLCRLMLHYLKPVYSNLSASEHTVFNSNIYHVYGVLMCISSCLIIILNNYHHLD